MEVKKNVLVSGGAGYIGSHACKALARAGFQPVVFDNLSTGWAEAVKFGPLLRGDLMDRAAIDAALAEYKPVAVMHFAALSLVGESMTDPAKYWRTNVNGSLNLIEATVAAGIRNFVFSSTCATYGDQDGVVLNEQTPQYPINAGADPEGELGEQHRPETHLIPLMLEAVQGMRPALTVYGDDYPTRDGTCVRDYVHVMDLVEAHVLGLRWLLDGRGSRAFNLGTGNGFTVREVIDASRSVTNREVPIIQGARRPGDAAALVSGSERAISELGWQPSRSSLPQMIGDAWRLCGRPVRSACAVGMYCRPVHTHPGWAQVAGEFLRGLCLEAAYLRKGQ
jgi:UDP-glucose 4-epimerase